MARQVQKRANAAGAVGERHQRASVHEPTGRAEILSPGETKAHFVLLRGYSLETEEPTERHRILPVHLAGDTAASGPE